MRRRPGQTKGQPTAVRHGRPRGPDVATTVLAAPEGHRLALNELLMVMVGSYVLRRPEPIVTHPTTEQPMPPIARSCE